MYVTQEELKNELTEYKKTCEGRSNGKIKTRGIVSERLGYIIRDIVKGLASRTNGCGYTWKEDMESEGILTILKYMHNYDESANPHAYLSKIAQHAFIQYIEKQKKHSHIKDKLYNMNLDMEDEYMEKAFNYENMRNKEELEFTKTEK